MWRFALVFLGAAALAQAQRGVEEQKENQILESRQGIIPLGLPQLQPQGLLGLQNPLQQLLGGQLAYNLPELQAQQRLLGGLQGTGGLSPLAGLNGLGGLGLGVLGLQSLGQISNAINRIGALNLGVNPLMQLAALRDTGLQSDFQSRLQQLSSLLAPGRSGEDQESVQDLITLASMLGVGENRVEDRFNRPLYFSDRHGNREDELANLLPQRLSAFPDAPNAQHFPSAGPVPGFLSESGRSHGLPPSGFLQGLTQRLGLESLDSRKSPVNRIGTVESRPLYVTDRRRDSNTVRDSGENFRFPNYS